MTVGPASAAKARQNNIYKYISPHFFFYINLFLFPSPRPPPCRVLRHCRCQKIIKQTSKSVFSIKVKNNKKKSNRIRSLFLRLYYVYTYFSTNRLISSTVLTYDVKYHEHYRYCACHHTYLISRGEIIFSLAPSLPPISWIDLNFTLGCGVVASRSL